jgi:ATP-dependent DNA ligase
MPLARLHTLFDREDWIFEPKIDGLRAIAYLEGGQCRLMSRPLLTAPLSLKLKAGIAAK